MSLVWHDYDPRSMGYVEEWLDAPAVKSTGLDEGFRAFYEYWCCEGGFVHGEDLWCKVVSEDEDPFGVIAFCEHEGKVIIMEVVVTPEKRGRGLGTRLLKELLETRPIPGLVIEKSEAVIFLNNTASQKAFENAGFRCYRTHEDGDALHYLYESRENK